MCEGKTRVYVTRDYRQGQANVEQLLDGVKHELKGILVERHVICAARNVCRVILTVVVSIAMF